MSQKKNDLINIQGPDIEGITYRRFRGPEDYPVIANLVASSKNVDGVERVDTQEQITLSYSHLVNCKPEEDMVFVEINGEPVAYSRVYWNHEAATDYYLYHHLAHIHADARRKGIGTAILHHNESHLREIARKNPAGKGQFFQMEGDDKQIGLSKLALHEGYEPARYGFIMVRPDMENIPDLPLPDGVELRPATPEHYRKIWDAMSHAFEDHWGFVPPTEEEFIQWKEDASFQPDLWQIAWYGDEVVGTVLGFIIPAENEEYHRLRGWTEEITTHREWRKKGIAKALIAYCLRALKTRGMQEAQLGVDTENLSGALRVYESMGYKPVTRQTIFRKCLG
jgi:mycothiol synthase